jgi:alpha-tubulin suppressor-like RCC1 family protein
MFTRAGLTPTQHVRLRATAVWKVSNCVSGTSITYYNTSAAGMISQSTATLKVSANENVGSKIRVLCTATTSGALFQWSGTMYVDVNVIMPQSPVIDNDLPESVVPVKDKATFSFLATSSPSPTYKWEKSLDGGETWTTIENAASSTYTVTIDENTDGPGTLYHVIASNAGGSVTSRASRIEPTIPAFDPNETLPATFAPDFDHADLLASAYGFPAPVLSWEKKTANGAWTVISGANTSSLSLSNLTTTDIGSDYRITATNSVGSASATTTLSGIPAITVQPEPQIGQNGDAFNFSVTAHGLGTLQYQWFFNGVLLSGATSSSLYIADATKNHVGIYTVEVSNSQGFMRSEQASFSFLSAASRAIYAASGDNHVVFIDNTGNLYGLGDNDKGQLGQTHDEGMLYSIASKVKTVAAGQYHTLYITNDGKLWALGGNSSGQLGIGNSADATDPTLVAENVAKVSASKNHSMFVNSDGEVFSFGYNYYGQLGDNSVVNRNAPVKIADNATSCASGFYHNLYIDNSNRLWGMGDSDNGKLGNYSSSQKTAVAMADNVVATDGGGEHSLWISSNGTLWTMGDNAYGQLGNNSTTDSNTPVAVANDVSQISAGYRYTVFVTTDNKLFGTGENNLGQLGTGSTANSLVPVEIATGVKFVAACLRTTLFIKTDGTIWGMGDNSSGQLVPGGEENYLLPVKISLPLAASIEILSQPQSQIKEPGETAYFVVEASTEMLLTYQWLHNGAVIPSATGPTLTVANVSPADAGWYLCIVSNDSEVVSSRMARLTIGSENAIREIEEQRLSVYPNPATDMLHVKFPFGEKTENLIITDIAGRMMDISATTMRGVEGEAIIDVSRLSAGIYLVRVGSQTTKVVKR